MSNSPSGNERAKIQNSEASGAAAAAARRQGALCSRVALSKNFLFLLLFDFDFDPFPCPEICSFYMCVDFSRFFVFFEKGPFYPLFSVYFDRFFGSFWGQKRIRVPRYAISKFSFFFIFLRKTTRPRLAIFYTFSNGKDRKKACPPIVF
jgi:hypothetical protein